MQNKMPSSKRTLQDPNPRRSPLKVTKDCFKAKKPAQVAHLSSPVVVQVQSPKVIHTRPQDFMRVVQLLTGQSSSSLASSASSFSFAVGQNGESRPREFRFYWASNLLGVYNLVQFGLWNNQYHEDYEKCRVSLNLFVPLLCINLLS